MRDFNRTYRRQGKKIICDYYYNDNFNLLLLLFFFNSLTKQNAKFRMLLSFNHVIQDETFLDTDRSYILTISYAKPSLLFSFILKKILVFLSMYLCICIKSMQTVKILWFLSPKRYPMTFFNSSVVVEHTTCNVCRPLIILHFHVLENYNTTMVNQKMRRLLP